ncbi:hypothetical protein GCM10011490_24380 [Pseudoclavibacter endophyticus]|uniref:Uncharacterized protein n=1 Tax=Pseudoclavibacter endophyticus TaxID=1778590 RepID=A0A6H9WP16_9MICO|nr:hypothetical protein [Pseudoclavibacter endophyticus]KAB1647781.1 hypothetical protein F8O04_12195 [Pseudoclavibacter endophyticus]GGA72718.1 hypothetical protein GCM10011490_24380 [Pseudoclavibacter endophyticus]
MTDLTALEDDELNALRVDVLCEQERRARLASIPGQVADLARQYAGDGGDPAELAAALTPLDEEEQAG